MNFAHYKGRPVGIAVDLVNTLDAHSDREHLTSPGDARQFLEERLGGSWRVDEAQLEEIRDLRDRLRAVLRAGDPKAAVARLNALLAEVGAVPRMSLHDGTPHLHFEAGDDSPARRLGAVAAVGLGVALVDGGLDRFGACASDTCEDVFVDTSKNRSRRYCSDTCATRENVAAHRRRRRGA
jgi:predicted RNA-binding Zn ribbon-like protein